jgi:dTDP-4-amino-4,6-dideoxygalactose transaminase
VTDGDLRRALLSGATINCPLSTLEAKEPIIAPYGSDDLFRLKKMRELDINAILVFVKNGDLSKVVSRTSLDGKLFLSPPHIGSSELSYIQRAFDENWVAPAGPNLSQFEEALALKTGRSYSLALSSGSAALHLALRVLNIRDGDRVYVSDLTFAASLQPILYEHAEPVLIDADPLTWNMSITALKRQLELDRLNNNLPKAIIVVHLYGQSSDMVTICELGKQFGVYIIEDAAESLGATFGNRPSGSYGILSAFSFNGNKIITTSGGGALVSDDQTLIEYARKLSTQGRDDAEHYQHSEIAYNYRM